MEESLEVFSPEIFEAHDLVARTSDNLRHQDFVCASAITNSRGELYCGTEEVAAVLDRLSCVDANAYVDRLVALRIVIGERALEAAAQLIAA